MIGEVGERRVRVTWVTPRRVKTEQQQQWRRQGVARESATVTTCRQIPKLSFQTMIKEGQKLQRSG